MNVVTVEPTTASESTSSMKGREQTRTEQCCDAGETSDLANFPDSFVRWVNHGEVLHH